MAPGKRRAREGGFTYLAVLFLVALMGLGLAGTSELWSLASQRAHERELLWTGNQYARALKSYYDQSPGVRQYPVRLEDLVEDKRFPMPRHHLRQIYPDPIAHAGWGVILNSDGRIGGVRSLAGGTPLKQAGFPLRWEDFNGRSSYSDWRFIADVNLLQIKPPGAAASAARAGVVATQPTRSR
jgi:type II secretory pathway pseudopilin PulG